MTEQADWIAPDGPFKVELKVAVIGDGHTGEAVFTLPPGRVPTAEAIAAAVHEVMAKTGLAENGFRLMGRHEFVQSLFDEKTGGAIDLAIPGPDSFALINAA